MARTAKANRKRPAPVDDGDSWVEVPPKKTANPSTSNETRARQSTLKGKGKANMGIARQETNYSEGLESPTISPMMELQRQLLKIQSERSAASKSHLTKFTEQVKKRELQALAELTERREAMESTRGDFIDSVAAILSDQRSMFETLNSQRQSLKEASIKLIQTAVTLQASIKQILEQDTGFGQSWESSLTEATAEIQGLSKAAGTELEGFLKGEDGGWNRAVKKTTKGIKKLLKEVDDDKTKVKDEY